MNLLGAVALQWDVSLKVGRMRTTQECVALHVLRGGTGRARPSLKGVTANHLTSSVTTVDLFLDKNQGCLYFFKLNKVFFELIFYDKFNPE